MLHPVRKIGIGYGGSLRGTIPSQKIGSRVVRVESALERSFCLLQEFDLNVSCYGEQPVSIAYLGSDGRPHRYTPDFLVEYHDLTRRPILVEVKYRAELVAKAVELATKFAAAHSYAAGHGWEFRVYTELEIQTALLGNARLLLRFRSLSPRILPDGTDLNDHLLSLLATEGPWTPASWAAEAAKRTGLLAATILPHCWHLLSWGRIAAPLNDVLLTMNTVLSIL